MNRVGTQNSYSHNVRIGNWNEDKQLNELRMQEYLHNKKNGTLLMHSVKKQLNEALQDTPLSYCADNKVHIGDSVMLYSARTKAVLSVDSSTKIMSADTGYFVTTSTIPTSPVVRNVFIIEAYGDNIPLGSIVKLGQNIRLRANPKWETDKPYYLTSQPKSTQSFSPVTRLQEVCVMPTTSYETVWVAQYKDTSKRFEMEGSDLPSNVEIVLQHASTKAALASDTQKLNNDFGSEYEVCAHSYIKINKKQGLYQEQQGLTTTDIAVRTENNFNHWAFLTATAPPPAEDGLEKTTEL